MFIGTIRRACMLLYTKYLSHYTPSHFLDPSRDLVPPESDIVVIGKWVNFPFRLGWANASSDIGDGLGDIATNSEKQMYQSRLPVIFLKPS